MHLINKFNKKFRFLLCVIDIFSKYARVVPLKHKKGITITNAFQKMSNDQDPKFKVGDHVRISKDKIIFAK